MTIDDVNYVNMSIPDAKAGLDGGSVDVALLLAQLLTMQGSRVITW